LEEVKAVRGMVEKDAKVEVKGVNGVKEEPATEAEPAV
jgi:hypothetical protein